MRRMPEWNMLCRERLPAILMIGCLCTLEMRVMNRHMTSYARNDD